MMMRYPVCVLMDWSIIAVVRGGWSRDRGDNSQAHMHCTHDDEVSSLY